MKTIPDIRDLIMASEFTLSGWQADRINHATLRPRHGRWFIAPEGTQAPGARIEQADGHKVLAEPWSPPWERLNNPGDDDMITMCVLDESDASHGILIMLYPTPAARQAWRRYSDDYSRLEPGEYASLGSETNVLTPFPHMDYRAVFRHVWPAPEVSRNAVRWHFSRPMAGQSSWDVMTAGWHPAAHRTVLPEADA